MLFLFKIWIFDFNFQTLLSFLIGVVSGIIVAGLILSVIVLISLKDKKFSVKAETGSLSEQEALDMIEKAVKSFKDRELRGKKGKFEYMSAICKDLVYGIASSFYPKSKYPMLEISVDEAIDLIGYIQKRVDEILSKKGIRILKRFKFSSIYNFYSTSRKVTDSKGFKAAKNVSKVGYKVSMVLNVINPLNYVKKAFSKTVVESAITHICKSIIQIVGEESFKIYSKSVLHEVVSIESQEDALYKEFEEDIKSKYKGEDEILISVANKDFRFKSKAEVYNNKITYNSIFNSEFKGKERILEEV